MKILEEKILAEGCAVSGEILRVDSFINHQTDPVFMKQNKKRIRVKLHAFFVFLFFSSPPILRIFAPKKKR